MKLDDIVSWYQKKIGTYDKEPWEKTVEEKILDGFSSVTLKTAKLKTELIDVDLVRGSTFPKAKPKQSLLTVIYLAILRYLFLPLYAQWWVRQTSPNTFALFLFLYITQMINWAVYTFNVNRLDQYSSVPSSTTPTTTTTTAANNYSKLFLKHASSSTEANTHTTEHIVSISELLIPMALSFLLSLIHSQIVATNIAQSGSKCSKRRRFSNASQNGRTSKDVGLRRRKKLVKLRSQDVGDNLPSQLSNQRKTLPGKKYCSDVKNTHLSQPNLRQKENVSSIIRHNSCTPAQPTPSTTQNVTKHLQLDLTHNNNGDDTECQLRRVNWRSPIHKCASINSITIDTQEKQQQTSPQSISTTSSMGENASVSSSSNSSPSKAMHIDLCVQEFYDDLIDRTTNNDHVDNINAAENRNRVNAGTQRRGAIGEDDGFESLNGKSSSGEETNNAPNSNLNQTNLHSQKVEEVNENSSGSFYRRKVYHVPGSLKLTRSQEVSSEETEEEGDEGDLISSPATPANTTYNECTTSATEWLGITTNSEECSYSSDLDNSDNYKGNSDDYGCDLDFTPATILNLHGASDRISCTIWDQHDIKKAQMSVLEISSCIIDNVESMTETNDYVYIGIFFSILLSLIPCFCRLCEVTFDNDKSDEINYFDIPMLLWEKASFSFIAIFRFAFGQTQWERLVLVLGFLQRLCLTLILFMIFAVAERTFKQRFLYAKLFSHLTSSRRARKSNLPHFRLNKVRSIKTWLSVRSYLKKRGPQRSVDVIVSAAFMLTLFLLGFLSVEWLKDSVQLHSHLNLEALLWSTAIGVYVLRYMTLGNKTHHKYRSVSVLITEQINLYLQIEKKPKKKDELMVANSVLKLAADLLKELETPFKISGLSANPYLFTTIKVVILSALSGVLSEMLGFKLKLHKIKIK
ncbi:putative homeodomain transcription factor [Glossina fuscipes]|uniref:Homeodomain transcription factor n=1 Tax=Glossina fuscipes TaxID=7396 RepID=A0A9C6DRA6_9MUSC|nr:putative homeodomain transcription factor [Glossina fuscipes]